MDRQRLTRTPPHQSYHLDIPGFADHGALSLREVHISEALGEPYEIVLTATAVQPIDLLALLDRPATFTVSPVDEAGLAAGLSLIEATLAPVRRWGGVVRQAARISHSVDETVYELRLAPRLARLADFTDTRLFQNQDIPAVLRQILRDDLGLRGDEYQFKTSRAYPVLEHITQYNETTLAFITRLCESCGLFYYFEQAEDHETIVFADDATHYRKALHIHQYRPDAGLESGGVEAILDLTVTARPLNSEVQRLDYNYRSSGGADLLGTQAAPPKQPGQVGHSYRWGTHHKDPEQGQAAARLAFEIQYARQVLAAGKANVVALAPAQIFRTDGPSDPLAEFGWVITRITHRAARNRPWRSDFTAMPAERTFRLEQVTPKPTIAGTLPARITSPSRYTNAYLNEAGLYRVTFLFDQTARNGGWPPAGSSRLMRLAKPYAGDTYGWHFPLIDGTEVQIAFQNGDIDRPYIAHALHDQTKPDHVTNKNHTRNVIRTPQNNKIRLEDKDDQQHIKIATEYGKSQLNLGHLVDASRKKRGDGFELRTDGWGAIRAGRGLFISADAQAQARGQQLDMAAADEQLQDAHRLMQGLREAAQQAKAELADLHTQKALLQDQLKELKQAGLLLSAPAGIAATTPASIQHSAGGNLILTARGQGDVGVLKRLTLAAGEAISVLAHKMGLQLFAAQGTVDIQAQSGEMHLASRQAMNIASTENTVTIAARQKLLLTCGGAYIKLEGGGIEIGGPGDLRFRTASFGYTEPCSLDSELPSLPKSQMEVPAWARYSR